MFTVGLNGFGYAFVNENSIGIRSSIPRSIEDILPHNPAERIELSDCCSPTKACPTVPLRIVLSPLALTADEEIVVCLSEVWAWQ